MRMRQSPGRRVTVRVRLYKDDVEGPGGQLTGLLGATAEEVVFGGFEPGTYTVWIDTLTAAPLVLHNVKLTDANIDLGTHNVSVGSRLLIHVKVKEGQSPSRMHLWATPVDQPAYTRGTDATGETVILSGLGKGRFRVSGGFYAGTGGIQEEIEFDGKNDIERTIDLR